MHFLDSIVYIIYSCMYADSFINVLAQLGQRWKGALAAKKL